MKNKCLYCYGELTDRNDFHEKCCIHFFGVNNPPKLDYTLDQMAELAKKVVERSVTVPGVQPKLSLSLVKEKTKQVDQRLTVVGALGGNYIFKPPVLEYPEMPQNEHLTMRLAEVFAIRTVSSSLIRLKSGELSYITKRIDRTNEGEKMHMIDMFQITEAFDKYRSSMEKIGKALHQHSSNTLLDKLFFFEIALFSFLTGNNDMHLKNFSMLKVGTNWVLAPAYDLLNVSILIPDDKEELALTLGGKKNKLTRDDFETFGKKLGLSNKQVQATFKRFFKNKQVGLDLIKSSFLSKEMQNNYIKLFESRFDRLFN